MSDQNVPLGAAYTSLALLAGTLAAAMVKWASHGYSAEFLVVVRWVAGLALFMGMWLLARSRPALATRRLGMQMAAGLCWTGATYSYYLAIRFIPLLDATLLLNTSALFGPLVARVLAGVREPWPVWLGTVVGFVGVVVLIGPDQGIVNPWALAALAAGLLIALRVHCNRELCRSDPKERITFYSLSVGLAASLVIWASLGLPVGSGEGHLFTPSLALRPWLVDSILAASVAALGLLLMLQAWLTAFGMQYASVGKVGPFRFSGVVFAALLDWLIWHQAPTARALIGFGFILAGALLVLLRGSKEPTRAHLGD